jgi:hypothetical protein
MSPKKTTTKKKAGRPSLEGTGPSKTFKFVVGQDLWDLLEAEFRSTRIPKSDMLRQILKFHFTKGKKSRLEIYFHDVSDD